MTPRETLRQQGEAMRARLFGRDADAPERTMGSEQSQGQDESLFIK